MSFQALFAKARHGLPVLLAWLVLASLLLVIASTYVGHASSPYDMCRAPDGRPMACALYDLAGSSVRR